MSERNTALRAFAYESAELLVHNLRHSHTSIGAPSHSIGSRKARQITSVIKDVAGGMGFQFLR